MADFDTAVMVTLEHEGGFSENQVTGEVVNFGITAKFLAGQHLPCSPADVEAMTRQQAINLYRIYFWQPLNCASIQDQELAAKVFDIAVNQGLGTGARLLQKAVNDLQLGDAVLTVDGQIGPATIAAVNALPASNLLTQFRHRAGDHYRDIAQKNPDLAPNLPGWLARLAS